MNSTQPAVVLRLPRVNSEILKERLSELLSGVSLALTKLITRLKENLSYLFSIAYEDTQKLPLNKRLSQIFMRIVSRGSNRQSKRFARFFTIVLVLGLGIFGINRLIQAIQGGTGGDQRIEIQGPRATLDVSRDFQFSLRNDKGEEVSKIKYTVESAELRDEIIVKGQRATAVKGRTFLILNLKVTNDFNQAIEIYTKNYVRLTRNNNTDELLAPDIHNDPVEVQAISTKLTRVGFPINDTDKDLKLHIGEIASDKQVVELNFH